MKKFYLIALVFFSCLSGFAQQKPKEDSVRLIFSISEVQFIYQALDNQHGDHVAIKRLMNYIAEEANKQIKVDSTSKKKQ